jgi:uncharacterized protein YjiS (DUF1127 family)
MKAIFESRSPIPATGSFGGYAVRTAPALAGVSSAVAAVGHSIAGRIDGVVEKMFTWQHRLADRRALESLDDRMLQDIGLTRGDVFIESSKPFWKQ